MFLDSQAELFIYDVKEALGGGDEKQTTFAKISPGNWLQASPFCVEE